MYPLQPYEPPRQTVGDWAHSGYRALLSLVPGGSVALEFFNNLLKPPLERRRDKWMEEVAQALRALEARGFKVEDLQGNEGFVTVVAQASQIAMRTHEKEKLEALRNAVVNSAFSDSPDDALKQIFLSWVDRFTPWHLRILAVLDDPLGWFERRGGRLTHSAGRVPKLLTIAYPELEQYQELLRVVVKDLSTSGLSTIEENGLWTVRTESGGSGSATTGIGKQFLAFISERPKA